MFDIETLIKQGESETLEFKKTTGEWKEIWFLGDLTKESENQRFV